MESIKQSWGCGFGMLVSLDLGARQKQEQPLRGWVGATGKRKGFKSGLGFVWVVKVPKVSRIQTLEKEPGDVEHLP